MADQQNQSNESSDPVSAGKYTVVARRYRPKTFEELVGQDTVAQGLLRAIETNRVGHAYLFTGCEGSARPAQPGSSPKPSMHRPMALDASTPTPKSH